MWRSNETSPPQIVVIGECRRGPDLITYRGGATLSVAPGAHHCRLPCRRQFATHHRILKFVPSVAYRERCKYPKSSPCRQCLFDHHLNDLHALLEFSAVFLANDAS